MDNDKGVDMNCPIAEAFENEEICLNCIREARTIFGDKTTSESKYTKMESTLAFGYLHCPEELRDIFLSTIAEANKRRMYFELYFWK